MAIEVKDRVRHNGKTYMAGEIIEEIKKADADRLVDIGVASFLREHTVSQPVTGGDTSNKPSFSPEEEEDSKALDEEFSLVELKEEAVKVGIEFKGTITKKELITLIIEQGKVAEFFDEEA